jgi:uncharacterized membrane protein required for colicin V production
MTSADILLLLIVAGAFLFGFFWGVIRGLLGLAGFVVVFVLSAHLSEPVGDYLAAQWTGYIPAYDHMLAFFLVFVLLYTLTLILITIGTRGSQDLSRYPLVDDVVGALLGACLAILCIAAITAILKTYYGDAAPVAGQGAEWSAAVYRALLGSTFGGQIKDSVVPALVALFGILMPSSVRTLLEGHGV